MISNEQSVSPIDYRLLAWLFLWSAILIAVTALLVSSGADAVLGFSMGCLISTWSTIGTWTLLIDLPWTMPGAVNQSATIEMDPPKRSEQRLLPRCLVILLLFLNATLFIAVVKDSRFVVGEVILSGFTSATTATLVWQWTRRRIYRIKRKTVTQRSISQLMGLSVTIAVLLAIVGPGVGWSQLTNSSVGMIVILPLIWVLLLGASLHTRWWLIPLTPIPAALGGIALTFLLSADGRNVDEDFQRMVGILCGQYFFSMVLLAMMRSSGHRWIG